MKFMLLASVHKTFGFWCVKTQTKFMFNNTGSHSKLICFTYILNFIFRVHSLVSDAIFMSPKYISLLEK